MNVMLGHIRIDKGISVMADIPEGTPDHYVSEFMKLLSSFGHDLLCARTSCIDTYPGATRQNQNQDEDAKI